MKRLAALAILFASPAAADVVKVSDCAYLEPDLVGIQLIECSLSNLSETPVAAVEYGVRVGQTDRTVPWYEAGLNGGNRYTNHIDGGIEPGETVPAKFLSQPINERANPDKLTIEVVILEARDIDGNPIE